MVKQEAKVQKPKTSSKLVSKSKVSIKVKAEQVATVKSEEDQKTKSDPTEPKEDTSPKKAKNRKSNTSSGVWGWISTGEDWVGIDGSRVHNAFGIKLEIIANSCGLRFTVDRDVKGAVFGGSPNDLVKNRQYVLKAGEWILTLGEEHKQVAFKIDDVTSVRIPLKLMRVKKGRNAGEFHLAAGEEFERDSEDEDSAVDNKGDSVVKRRDNSTVKKEEDRAVKKEDMND